jgi:hypothetical protein
MLVRYAAVGVLPMADRYTMLRSTLPASYIEYVEAHNGWEGDLGGNLGYVVIWSRQTVQERWDDYEMAQYLSEHWFPFGSDGGGEMLCFDLSSRSDRIFRIPYVGMCDEEALPWQSFADLIAAIRTAA